MYEGLAEIEQRNPAMRLTRLSSRPTNTSSRTCAGRGKIVVARRDKWQARVAKRLMMLLNDREGRIFKVALDYLATSGTTATGPDHVIANDLSESERWRIARSLRKEFYRGTYRPGESRTARIPKGSGRRTRELQIANVRDWATQRVIQQIIQPEAHPATKPFSFGFRPGLGRRHNLAGALAIAARDDKGIWILADIRGVFAQIPRNLALEAFEERLLCPKLWAIAETMIRGRTGRGLTQGSSLSPLLMNVFLNHMLDKPWSMSRGNNSLISHADDLLVLSRDRKNADRDLTNLGRWLRDSKVTRKAAPGKTIIDLNARKPADWLGFSVTQEGSYLDIGIVDRLWSQLKQDLELCHERDEATQAAQAVIDGMIGQFGPCYREERIDTCYAKIQAIVTRLAFHEIDPSDEFAAKWQESHRLWETIRTTIQDDLDHHFSAAPPA